jgi:hypothetical protein
MITVWVYVNTSQGIGHPDHLKIFATGADAHSWFKEHDPEGVAFEYPVIGEASYRMIRKPTP